jgi:polygalacturonase
MRILLFCLLLLTAARAAETPPWDPATPAAVLQPIVRVRVAPPAPVFRVQDYGAKGDGFTYDTIAIQKAIDACAGSGGSVVLADGRFVSANLVLRERMTFYVAKGAALLGGLEAADYPEVMPAPPAKTWAIANRRSLLYAFAAHGLIIDGEGEIDGRGRDVKISGKESLRPSLLRVFGSDDVIVRNVTFRNPRMWTCVYSECRRLTIQGTTTDAPAYIGNLDGMDICDSQDVLIKDNVVNSEDDAICLKSHGPPGLGNIRIENNRIHCHRANAIKIGTATRGPISGLRIINNVITGARFGGICIESVDGSPLRDVLVQGLEMSNVGQPVFIRLAARNGSLEPQNTRTPTDTDSLADATIDGVVIERLRALKCHLHTKTATSTITGLPDMRVRNITLRDVLLEVPGGLDQIPDEPPEMPKDYPQSNMFGHTPAAALYIRHADQVRLERVTVRLAKPDARPWLATGDTTVTREECTPIPAPWASSPN